jgi:hypothetical protein
MGLSSANFPDNLRIAPFDVVVKSRANTGEALTAATIEDACIFEPRTIKSVVSHLQRRSQMRASMDH